LATDILPHAVMPMTSDDAASTKRFHRVAEEPGTAAIVEYM